MESGSPKPAGQGVDVSPRETQATAHEPTNQPLFAKKPRGLIALFMFLPASARLCKVVKVKSAVVWTLPRQALEHPARMKGERMTPTRISQDW